MGLLEGRVAVVAGVGPGLGAALARVFAQEGAAVALAARGRTTIDALAAELGAPRGAPGPCGGAIAQPTDIADEASCEVLVQRVVEQWGGIDVLVHNAAAPGPMKPLAESRVADWRTAMDVNYFGALALVRAALPAMRGRAGANVVMVSSMASRDIQPAQGAYAASKAALNTVAKTLARELGPDGVRVNVLVPGWIAGPNAEASLRAQAKRRGIAYEDVLAEREAATALRRIASGEEIARCAVLLASDYASPVTGHLLDANAGEWM